MKAGVDFDDLAMYCLHDVLQYATISNDKDKSGFSTLS